MNWRPMDTAPKDGTHILLHIEDCAIEGWWENYRNGGGEWNVVSLSSHGCGCCSSSNADPLKWAYLEEPL